jgi:hypothetical protein
MPPAAEEHVGGAAQPVTVVIGSPASDHVSIRVMRRSHPGTADYWDGNWIRCAIGIRAHPFQGGFEGDLRSDELSRLRDDLARLYEHLDGEAGFANLDGYLAFDVKGDGIGHFTIEGDASDDAGSGQRLAFRLEVDQTQLPGIVTSLDEALRAFPVQGSPGD